MKSLKRVCFSLALLATAGSAFGDIPNRPGPQSEYEIRFSQPITTALLASVQFQHTENVSLPGCTAQVKTWEGGGTVITCQTRTSCFGRARPSCQVELNSGRGQVASAFCAVTEESVSSAGGYPYGGWYSAPSGSPLKQNHK